MRATAFRESKSRHASKKGVLLIGNLLIIKPTRWLIRLGGENGVYHIAVSWGMHEERCTTKVAFFSCCGLSQKRGRKKREKKKEKVQFLLLLNNSKDDYHNRLITFNAVRISN